MLRRTLSFLVLGLALVGCGDRASDEPAPPSAEEREAAEVRAGERAYSRYCALCHGRDGEGYAADNAPMLSNQEWLRSASDEMITAAIADGRPGTPMSAWSVQHGGPLAESQIASIVRYLRSWQRAPRAVVDEVEVHGDPLRGQSVFAIKCARCHGARGEGVDAIALGNPAFLRTVSDGFLQYAVSHGRTGTRMEAFSGQLTPEQIDDVVAYVRSLAPSTDLAPAPHAPELPAAPELPSLEELPLVIHPEGRNAHFTLRDDRFVPADDVHAALERGERMILLDARATSDWLAGRIPGALPVPFYEMSDLVEALPRDGTPMIAYCACPHAASGHVVDALRAAHFENTMVLDEGIGYWVEHGYPQTSGLPEDE
ncbi:MAG: c-type cytochrome [Sandaracinaceae bacterium]